MTRQEMFNRAVRGLASQGWRQSGYKVYPYDGARHRVTKCAYTANYNDSICHCAWGWVDPDIPFSHNYVALGVLHCEGIGVAGSLSLEDLEWASRLQACHDSQVCPENMRASFQEFALQCGLTWPADVP